MQCSLHSARTSPEHTVSRLTVTFFAIDCSSSWCHSVCLAGNPLSRIHLFNDQASVCKKDYCCSYAEISRRFAWGRPEAKKQILHYCFSRALVCCSCVLVATAGSDETDP